MTVYPSDWHEFYGDKTAHSANAIIPHVLSLFPSQSVIEVGCGNAHWTAACVANGITQYLVTDGHWNDRAGLLVDRDRFMEVNLNDPPNIGRRFDLAICLEVAEHVDQKYSDNVVDFLANCADVIVFGAAIPYQGGYGHINEQWPSWWRALFQQRGYVALDLIRPQFWSDRSIHYWYRQNTFVYVKSDRVVDFPSAREMERALGESNRLFDAVHPEKFEETASYESIALKRLITRLPAWLLKRIRA